MIRAKDTVTYLALRDFETQAGHKVLHMAPNSAGVNPKVQVRRRHSSSTRDSGWGIVVVVTMFGGCHSQGRTVGKHGFTLHVDW